MMNKRIVKLSSLFIIVFTLIACIYSPIPSIGGNPTTNAMNTVVAQNVSIALTEVSKNVDLELTRIFTEIELSPVSTPSINSENWLSSWLNSPTCQPPCWENIIPGQSTLNDSLKIIAQISGAQFQRISLTPHVNSKTTFAEWGWGQIATRVNSQIIASIDLYLPEEQPLTINRLIDAHGNPSSLVRGSCFGEFSPARCGYVLLYKEKGMVIYIDLSSKQDAPVEIVSDIKVTVISLSLQEDFNIFSEGNKDLSEVIWDGYKTYDFSK